jgi:arabinan endo-1,5-alpha-L-arabinosidase
MDTSTVLKPIPQWAHDSVPDFKQEVWAPDILRWHGRWWLSYACSSFGRNTSAIGLASSPVLSNASWTDHGCIISSQGGRDNWNAIDPNIIIDQQDHPWLVFGSFWDGIQLIPLNDSLHVPAGLQPTTIARRWDVSNKSTHTTRDSLDAGTNAIEAPFIFHHGNYYYLFVSWDYCCQGMKSTYRVVYGRSRHMEGPYLDRTGKDMLIGGGTVLLEGDKQQYEAVGHCAVYPHPTDTDKALFICHGYSVPLQGIPILVKRTLSFTPDEWITMDEPSFPKR